MHFNVFNIKNLSIISINSDDLNKLLTILQEFMNNLFPMGVLYRKLSFSATVLLPGDLLYLIYY